MIQNERLAEEIASINSLMHRTSQAGEGRSKWTPFVLVWAGTGGYNEADKKV